LNEEGSFAQFDHALTVSSWLHIVNAMLVLSRRLTKHDRSRKRIRPEDWILEAQCCGHPAIAWGESRALAVCGPAFDVCGRRRQDARPGLAKMYRVPRPDPVACRHRFARARASTAVGANDGVAGISGDPTSGGEGRRACCRLDPVHTPGASRPVCLPADRALLRLRPRHVQRQRHGTGELAQANCT